MPHDPNKSTQIQLNSNGDELNVGPTGAVNISSGGRITVQDGIGAVAGTGVSGVEQLPILHRTVITFDEVDVAMTDATTSGCHGSQKIYDFPQGLIEIIGAVVNLETAAAANLSATAALVGALGTAPVGTNNATLTTTEADIHPSISGTLVDSAGTLVGKTLPVTGSLPGIAALTDSSAGTAGDTLAALPTLTDSPATQDALRDDLNTNVWPVLKNWAASLAAKINALLAARRLFDGTGTAKDCYLNLAVPDAGSTGNSTVTVNGTVTLIWVNHGDV